MAKTNTLTVSRLTQLTAARVALVHLGFVLVFAITTIIFDTWNLFTAEAIKERWQSTAVLLMANIAIWFAVRQVNGRLLVYKALIAALALADIVFISMQIGNERGMASTAVAFYALPMVVIGVLRSRRATMAVAAVSAAAYVMTITAYFSDNYGEGLKVQLYGTAFLFSGFMMVMAGLLWALFKTPRK